MSTPELTASSANPAVVAAAITAAVALISLVVSNIVGGVRANRDRRREVFSKAFAAAISYAEFPYVVRRRRTSDPEEERVRISTDLRAVQEEIAYYSAWIESEAPKVANAYQVLAAETRRIAGKQIHDAWNSAAVASDAEMNMPDLGLAELDAARRSYLEALRSNLAPIRSHVDRKG